MKWVEEALDCLCKNGFSVQEADSCRKAFGKRLPLDMVKFHDEFIKRGGSEETWLLVRAALLEGKVLAHVVAS